MNLKKYLKKIILFTILTIALTSTYTYAKSRKEVKVYINGELMNFDYKPFIKDNRALVPLRPLYEKLGLEVDWENSTKSIIGKNSTHKITMSIGAFDYFVNGRAFYTDVAPILKNKRSYVPVRTIAESTGAYVKWDQKKYAVFIESSNKPKIKSEANNEFISHFNSDDFFKLTTKDDKIILNNNGDFRNFSLKIKDKIVLKLSTRGSIYDLSYLKDGHTKLSVNVLNNNFSIDEYKIDIYKKNNQIYFYDTALYKENLTFHKDFKYMNPKNHLDLKDLNKKEFLELKKLAKSITKDKKTDYDKLLAITDWVSNNLYYDIDALENNDLHKDYNPYKVLQDKKTFCEGYTNLTDSLLKLSGIPSRKVYGYAGNDNININSNRINHAWNEAFVDNRWLSIDTTWNSKNQFKNKEFIKRNASRKYTDPSFRVFSLDHLPIKIN